MISTSSAAISGGEGGDQLVLHRPERAVAVRLEEEQQPAGEGVEGAQGGGDLVGIVPEIVDHRDAVRLADLFEAAAQAR